MIKRFFYWIKQEILSVLPAFLFFFVFLNILNLTEELFLKEDQISTNFNFYAILIIAGIIAKTLIVINHLPFINLFPNLPLIYNILWKTFLYETSAFIVRLCIRLVPFLSWNDFSSSFATGLSHIDFRRFLAVQTWFLIFFFIFVTAQGLTRVLGIKKIKKLFLG